MRIAVFTGGSSAERAVAIASATTVVAALRRLGHEVSVVDTVTGVVARDREAGFLSEVVQPAPTNLDELVMGERATLLGGLLQQEPIAGCDLVFLALHGGTGEDGTIQHLLELAGIAFTGAGPAASAAAMDKDLAKVLFGAAGVPVAKWLMTSEGGVRPSAERVEAELGWPVVVKPSKQGSTVGLSVVGEAGGLGVAIDEALRHDDEVMLEEYVEGRELTVGILDDRPLAVGEIIPPGDLFDYESKYGRDASQEIFPADLPASVTADVQRLGLLAHRALKIKGYSRVDFRLSRAGELRCLEANTLPGLTSASLLPKSAAAAGVSFEELCRSIMELAHTGR